jgi:hypothetical protein
MGAATDPLYIMVIKTRECVHKYRFDIGYNFNHLIKKPAFRAGFQ